MKLRLFLLSSSILSTWVYASPDSFSDQCQHLQNSNINQFHIDKTILDQDAHHKSVCVVTAATPKRQGVGQEYQVKMEIRLPEQWNHNFLFQGGGGMDGIVRPAVGKLYPKESTATDALTRGYAVVSTDSGHQKPDASFGQDQQAKLDYAYAAIGKVTDSAKQLIQKFYGENAQKSYFMGCSNGGRSALQAALRYPTEFDAVLSVNPGLRLSRASIAQTWDVQQLAKLAPKLNDQIVLSKALTQKDLDIVQAAVLKQCDELDGIKDGIINNQQACHFNIKKLACNVNSRQECLTSDKIHALDQIFKGVRDSKSNPLYNSFPYDAGINAAGWREWKLGTSDTVKSNAKNVIYGNDSLPHYFMHNQDGQKFDQLTFKFDQVLSQTSETARINDADTTDFSTFAARGGKLIIVHGTSDPVFSSKDTTDWYNQVKKYNTQDFSRLFLVPGMNHCGGGNALNDLDPLTSLENWVNTNEAPTFIAAKGQYLPNTTQPICAYPKQAFYIKGQNPQKINSYHCQ